MSMKGWTKGEPGEPAFQQPELLSAALNSLGTNTDLTLEGLCKEFHFTPQTFEGVTGVVIPKAKAKPVTVLRFGAMG